MSQSRQYSENKALNATNATKDILTGSVMGMVEVGINHPLWSVKTRIQRGLALTLNPKILYRGVVPNMLSMMPITGIQVGLNGAFKRIFFKDSTMSNANRINCAFLAGATSAIISCPVEMIMTYQGDSGRSFTSVTKQILQQKGTRGLYNAFTATVFRDGVFTAFYLVGSPIFKTMLKPYFNDDFAATIPSGIVSGVTASLITQAADTVKTAQQAAPLAAPLNLKQGIQKVYSEKGIYGFFKGGLTRAARVTSAVTVMGAVKDAIEVKIK